MQSINVVDRRYITDKRLQQRRKEKEEREREEEKEQDEIIVDTFNNDKCSFVDLTRGTTEPKSVINLSVIYCSQLNRKWITHLT